MKNILTIDVEDWFMDTDISQWDKYEDRVVQSTQKVLDLLNGVSATFFVLGYVAEKHPDLVKEIQDAGHEIGTHGYSHKPLYQLGPVEFEKELMRSIKTLKSISGKQIHGHRACQFTVMNNTKWAIDIMERLGLQYDSSVFPVKTPLYGVPCAPLHPYHISSDNLCTESNSRFWELPLTVLQTPIKNIPVAGGFYLRILPYSFLKAALVHINKNNRPAVFYLHPWELDVGQPKIETFKWYHYYALSSTEKKFKQLLRDFEFISAGEWINNV